MNDINEWYMIHEWMIYEWYKKCTIEQQEC